ncbi:entericidin A/B family lipoprotein [Asaia sp. BMEF1]|uniref:entericidin A/B family lipoprotein n=1 Tax=Asaia TaxID=91914 RepID=UPI0004718DE2|nr:entericidin A/B family lipoprotein [Asaia platycodi]
MTTVSFLRTGALAVMLALPALGLTACNTLDGAGRDVSSVGHDVSRGANATQGAIHNSVPQAATH